MIYALGQVNLKIWQFNVSGKKAFNLQCYFYMINRINMSFSITKKNLSANVAVQMSKE